MPPRDSAAAVYAALPASAPTENSSGSTSQPPRGGCGSIAGGLPDTGHEMALTMMSLGVVVALGSVGARCNASRPYISGLRRASTAFRTGVLIDGVISAVTMPCAPGDTTSGCTTGA